VSAGSTFQDRIGRQAVRNVVKAIVASTLVFGISFGAIAAAADGELDMSFGVGGVARAGITDGAGGPSGCKPIVQPDGKIVICGTRLSNGATGSDFLIVRFTADGALDDGFGTNGLVTIDFDAGSGGDRANGIALQSDGKIVVAGTTHGAAMQSADFAVARLTADGILDRTFAGSGKTTIAFNLDDGVGDDQVDAVAIQPDGTIVLAGSAETASGVVVAVARVLGDGGRDAGFNQTGRVTFGFELAGATIEADNANGVAIDSKGRIVIAATANATAPQDVAEFGAARLLSNGELDPSFNGSGHTTIAFDPGTGISDALAFGVVIQDDDRILIPGYANSSPWAMQNMDMAAARLMPDGSPDMAFGVDGKIMIPFDMEASGVDAAIGAVEQPDGRLLFVGTALGEGTQYGVVARVTRDGMPDDSFGTLGRQTYDLGLTVPGTQAFTGVTLQGAKIIVGGIAFVPPLGSPQPMDCLVVRLLDDSVFADGFD
jgi:uncharacterized delta-60 repeat protein